MELQDIIEGLESAPRQGSAEDVPEGSRYIQISDTLARSLIECLKAELAEKDDLAIYEPIDRDL